VMTKIKTTKKKVYKSRLQRYISELMPWIIIVPTLIMLYITVWRPMIMNIGWSFFKMKGFTPDSLCGFDNYRRVVTDTQFLKILGNTLKYVGWSLVIGYIPPIFMAICLNELIHTKGLFRFSMYFPSIIPTIAVSMIFFLIFFPNESGLLNMFVGAFGVEPQQWLQNPSNTIMLIIISMTWSTFGATSVYYLAALQGVNRELYEAAVIDGAGIGRRVFHITLPQISGVMILFFVKQIISVFQIMEQPLAMTGGGPNNASVSLALQGYRYAFEFGNVGSSLALSVVTFVILIPLTLLYFVLDKKFVNN